MSDPSARRVTTFVFVTVFLDLLGFGIVIPLMPLYVTKMGGSPETVGFILSSFAFTQLVATPILGRLSDRLGRRPVILLSLLGNALSMVLFALATHLAILPLLFVSRILGGATAGNLAACQAAIADVTPSEDRAKGMGLIGAGIGLGMVLGPVLGGLAANFGPWAPPLGAAAMAAVDLALAFVLMPETNRTRGAQATGHAKREKGAWSAITTRPIPLVLALFFLTFLYMTNLQVALALITKARLGWTEREVGHVFGLFGLIMFIVQGVLIGRVTKVFRPTSIVIAGSLTSSSGLLLIAIAHHPIVMMAGLVLLGSGLGFVNPCLSTIASEHAGAGRQGAVLGIAQSAGGLARTVGPVFSGILYGRIAPGAPFTAGAVAALACAGLTVFLAETREPTPTSTT